MKTFALVLLCSSIALADPPADAPVADEPGVSVLVKRGEPAPFDGRLLSPAENLRRGKSAADCKGTLAAAQEKDVLLPKPAVAAIIAVAAAAVATSIGLGIALAKRPAGP